MGEVKLICKCIPGFESVAIKECEEKLQVKAVSDIRGRVSFSMKICDVCRVQGLRSVSHYWVVVFEKDEYLTMYKTNEEIFSSLSQIPATLSWEKALRTWKVFKMDYQQKSDDMQINGTHEHGESQGDSEHGESQGDSIDCNISKNYADIEPSTAGERLSFRVTGYRTGKHTFTSMECALHLGSGVNELFTWKVDMTNFDIEVVLHVLDNSLSIGIQLTRENQSIRNITHFGPTTLKANICYALLQFAQVSPGDVVCDPMCGSGSISIEGAVSCPGMFHIAGENHPIALEHSSDNIKDVENAKGDAYSFPVSFLRWDVYQLPLRTSSVDRIVTDLPFGKRMGNKERNMFLYPIAMKEMGRICRPHGKAVLLTQHKGALARAVKMSTLWKQMEVRKIFMGGLKAVVYLLQRTEQKFPEKLEIADTPVAEKSTVSSIHDNVEKLSIR